MHPAEPQRRTALADLDRPALRQLVTQVGEALHAAGMTPSHDLSVALIYLGTAIAGDGVPCDSCNHRHQLSTREFLDSGQYLECVGPCRHANCDCTARMGEFIARVVPRQPERTT